ncbi:adaptin ear-binding coat-associated protein 2 [Senna tora]|uniref:Adaptin ear-binding coat-associated protein 2 n=1 Tax=Senna tora TaxID=362788 RepID=A0A834TJH1_9FABA|nr:adaptin ear-binding coat-associated protein 2 [Senna tora]
MQKEKQSDIQEIGDEHEDTEAIELVLFQVPECYVYIIPPRKSAASYRADEWDVNKWAWEGILKVISKGEVCIIKLEDKKTGELYARAFLRNGEPHPVEPVIDSSRYFVLRIEENIGGRLRHAFIGIGFRERTEAYDFQAALHDHMKYLNKKKTAEEMEQHYQQTSSVDYSLKEGETLKLQIKTNKSGSNVQSKLSGPSEEKGNTKESLLSIKLPPPPPAPVSPTTTMQISPTNFSPEKTPKDETLKIDKGDREHQNAPENQSTQDIPDDDFGDFQIAG